MRHIEDPELRALLKVDEILELRNGWHRAEAYATIQTATVGEELYLVGRGFDGLDTYRFDRAEGKWDLLIDDSPGWSDNQGWDGHEYHSTIQTAVVGNQLHLLGRSAAGLVTLRLRNGEWEGGLLRQFDGGDDPEVRQLRPGRPAPGPKLRRR